MKMVSSSDRTLGIVEVQNQQLQSQLNRPSPVARLAIVLFSTGLALLVAGFFTQ
jgi:hypothetical protein